MLKKCVTDNMTLFTKLSTFLCYFISGSYSMLPSNLHTFNFLRVLCLFSLTVKTSDDFNAFSVVDLHSNHLAVHHHKLLLKHMQKGMPYFECHFIFKSLEFIIVFSKLLIHY